jgi:two-component system osmolarity sensor histidine kinase EnvZ
MNFRPRSLFGRTAITIALTLVTYTIVSVGAFFYFVFIPMTKRSAHDFAAEIVSAAHMLQDVPEERHEEIQQELLGDHGLLVAAHEAGLSTKTIDSLYLKYFQESLIELAGEELPIFEAGSGPLVWVDVPAHGKLYRLGFNRERLGTNPPLALAMVLGGGALLTILASLLEVRRIVGPLERLSTAVSQVGRGRNPAPVPEDGPEEIAELARTINSMSEDIAELGANRTVMIAGVSHDLRTPLTRLAIAVEMLDEDSRPELVAGIRRDLEAMNDLVSQFLQFSQGMESQVPVQVDLWKIVESLAGDLGRDGAEIRLHRADPPCVFFADSVALQRVLANLLKNAAQHGRGKPIDVQLNCSARAVSIEVSDRGPGIPPAQLDEVFHPFRRLEPARHTRTGGSGLGLAIVRQLAVSRGWTIELLSRDGGGTTARLGLPTTCRFALSA